MSLKTKLEKRKNEIGLVGTRLKFLRPNKGRGISEHITHDWREIVVSIRKDLDLVPDQETAIYLRKVGVENPLEVVAMDMLNHGGGHRELPVYTTLGCPFKIEFHDQIKDGVAQALQEKGKQGLESYVSNAFEDILDNINTRKHTRHVGQILFWNNEGLETENKKFSGFYEAFVKLNLLTWGEPADATLLRRFYINNSEVQTAVEEFKTYLEDYLGGYSVIRLHKKDDLFNKLFHNKQDWRELAYRFTSATADLLEDNPEMRMCFGVPADGELPFDEEMKLPGTQEEIAYKRFKAGDEPSKHTDPILQLDALYRRISRNIPVKTSSYTKAQGIPIAYYGKRNLKEDETIRIKRMKGIGFSEDGQLTIKMSRYDLQYPARYKVHQRNFPKLRIALIDQSGSMQESPDGCGAGNTSFIPWGDNSKYHYALKGIYGIDNFLEKQGIARYVQSEVITFSGKTERKGQGLFRNENERKKLLRHPSGGTNLNSEIVKQAVQEKSFLISISDGELFNWDSMRESFMEAVSLADYCHIQIGSANEFTKDLESFGVPVQYVQGNDDLSRLMIDMTANYYKQGDFKSK